MQLSDRSLARRLERTEALASVAFIESRAAVVPDSGAQWTEIGGAYAMYDGPRSACTQTFGLGMFQAPDEPQMAALEDFFETRSAPVFHEVSPLADKGIVPLLNARGYHPIEFTSVMFRPLQPGIRYVSEGRGVRVRLAHDDEGELWARTAAEGWRDHVEIPDLLSLLEISAAKRDGMSFLAEIDGTPVAAAAMAVHEGVALLAGASTIPEWRNRGAQLALLESRLESAAQAGCDLAMMCAEPGSNSQRNAERQGFRIAYTRVKWLRASPSE